MKSIYLAVVLLISLFLQLACSGNTANVGNADANAAQASEFDYITDANIALAEGDRLFDENQTERAIEAFKRAVKLNPDLADAHFKLGIAYALIEAEQQKAGDEVATSSRIRTRSQMSFERAVEAYKKLLEINPKDDAAQFNLGRSYNKLNKDDQAEDAFRQAVKLKPGDTDYQTEYGSILIKLAKYHEATGPLRKAIQLDAENSRAADLLDDAEAGAKRVDFVPKSNTNSNANLASNANIAANGNSVVKPANTAVKPTKEDIKVKKPASPANKPR